MNKVTIIIMNKDGEWLPTTIAMILMNTKYPHEIIIANGGKPVGYPGRMLFMQCTGGSICKDFKQALRCVDTEYIVGIGSDCFPQENWLTYAVEDFEKNFTDGVGILALNDGKQCGKIATMCLTTRKTIDQVFNGELLDTRFMHYFADTLITYIAKKKGIYAYSERAKCFHQYEQDKAEEKRCWKHDEALYNKLTKEIDEAA